MFVQSRASTFLSKKDIENKKETVSDKSNKENVETKLARVSVKLCLCGVAEKTLWKKPYRTKVGED